MTSEMTSVKVTLTGGQKLDVKDDLCEGHSFQEDKKYR